MCQRLWIPVVISVVFLGSSAFCQNLDGSAFDPAKDPNIDLFMGSWIESMPRHTHGTLIERDILTKGDALNPPRKAAVLQYIDGFTHGTLYAHNSTVPTTLKGKQEVFYILSGTGIITAAGKSHDIFDGACFLVPEGLEFTMTATGSEPLTMYIVTEPVTGDFKPRKEIVIKNNNTFPINKTVGHWNYQEKDLITRGDGLAILHAVITLTLDPMTIGHPHFHVEGTEEVWTTIKGMNLAWLGKEIRNQPPGTAYIIPPDGKTNHSNINESKDEQVVMLYFAVRQDLYR